MSRSKYHASKVVTSEGTFDSKKEYKRWIKLKAMEDSGEIKYLKRQVAFELIPKQVLPEPRLVKGRLQHSERSVNYVADFTYWIDGKYVVEDTKGMRLPEYIIKRKLLLFKYGIQIKEV